VLANRFRLLLALLLGLPALLFSQHTEQTAFATEAALTQVAKLISDDAEANDFFGVSVDIDGDTLLVGANGDDDYGSASGAAYVFVRSGSTWIQQAKLTPADGAIDDEFGRHVVLDGDTALVGSHWDDDAGDASGAAYVFVRSGSTWIQQAKLTASDAEAGAEFGWGIALEGNIAMVGAPLADALGTNSGAVYVFQRSGSTWTQQVKLTADDGDAEDRFGFFLDLDNGTALFGALGDDERGYARCSKRPS
jgi:hypothetical protein